MADGFSVPAAGTATEEAANGSSGSSSGSSQWYGSADDGTGGDKKRYMQSYLQVIMNLYGKYSMTPQQQKLAMRAFAMRASPSVYAEMLRRFDPRYVRTDDYKNRLQEAKDLYQRFRPGRPVPHAFMAKYARSGMTLDRLQERIEKSRWFKREFAGWDEAKRAGSPAGMSPESFINYRTMWNRALQNAYGSPASRLEQRMMFDSAMTPDELSANMLELFGGQEALKWATGRMLDREKLVKGALTSKFGYDTLNRSKQSRATLGGYLGSENRAFDIGADAQGMLRIAGI